MKKSVFESQPSRLPRQLSRFDAIMMIVGNMIGIGIFTTTGYIAGYLSSPFYLLLVWLLGGLYALFGALTYAELSTRFPLAGGDFHYLKHAYHPLLAFLFGWSAFAVTYTGSIATIAVGFASYFLNIFPESVRNFQMVIPLIPAKISALKLIAIGITLLFTWINTRGIKKGAIFQNIFTVLGILILLSIVLMGFVSPNGSKSHFLPFFPQGVAPRDLSLIGVALVGVIFTYSGWTTVVYIAGEIKKPRTNLPFSLALSVIVVLGLYIMVNLVYLYALPLPEMVNVVDIGYQTLLRLMGEQVGWIFSVLIMLAVLSTLNSTILSGARIYYAMAKEGIFFSAAKKIHERYQSPANSLWMQGIWSVVLILSGSFNQLLAYTVFVMVLFSFLSGISLFVLRKNSPDENDSYRVWGYPVVPALYILISFWVMVNTFYHRPVESLLGILLILLGYPFYRLWSHHSESNR